MPIVSAIEEVQTTGREETEEGYKDEECFQKELGLNCFHNNHDLSETRQVFSALTDKFWIQNGRVLQVFNRQLTKLSH
jgi:hypothetical protein